MERVKSISEFKVLNLSELSKIKGGLMQDGATPATKPGKEPATRPQDPSTQPEPPAKQP